MRIQVSLQVDVVNTDIQAWADDGGDGLNKPNSPSTRLDQA